MESTVKILDLMGAKTVADMQSDLQKVNATGKTAASIRYEVTSEGTVDTLIISGRPFTSTIETGRGPAKNAGDGSFQKSLEDWCQARGFQSKTSKKGIRYFLINSVWMSAKSLAYLLNKQGDQTFRLGGKEIYSNNLIKNVTLIKAEIRKDFHINFSSFVKNALMQ